MAITASIVGATYVTVMMNGMTRTITNDHTNYQGIRDALKRKDHARVESLIDIKTAIINFVSGKVVVDGDKVMYGDREVKGSVVTRILAMVREGFDAKPMINFLDNLMSNPSKRAVDELYGFLEATNLPITEDGCFLAYKKVRNDYKDFYTGTMDNSVGARPSMPRNQVNEDKDQTCSEGLHFCSFSYLSQYHGGNGRVVIVKINPKDVVSIPSDYNNAKGRASEYEIIGEHAGRETTEAFTAPVYANMKPSAMKVDPAMVIGGDLHVTGSITAGGTVTSNALKVGSPALVGYNTGRSDAANWRPFNSNSAVFTGAQLDTYRASYRKGFEGVRNAPMSNLNVGTLPVAPVESEEDRYDLGYTDGRDDAVKDSSAIKSARTDFTNGQGADESYVDGYKDGYQDNYEVDFEDAGYKRAETDVKAGRPYSDTVPLGVTNKNDANDYKRGYADGWHAAKIAQI